LTLARSRLLSPINASGIRRPLLYPAQLTYRNSDTRPVSFSHMSDPLLNFVSRVESDRFLPIEFSRAIRICARSRSLFREFDVGSNINRIDRKMNRKMKAVRVAGKCYRTS